MYDKFNRFRCVYMDKERIYSSESPTCSLAKAELDKLGISSHNPRCKSPESCPKRVVKVDDWMVWNTMFPSKESRYKRQGGVR